MLHETRIDDEYHTINRDRGLGNVRSKNDFSSTFWCRLENFCLHLARQIGVNWADDEFSNLISESASCFLQVLVTCFDFFLALNRNTFSASRKEVLMDLL